jgi:hypothetical protein
MIRRTLVIGAVACLLAAGCSDPDRPSLGPDAAPVDGTVQVPTAAEAAGVSLSPVSGHPTTTSPGARSDGAFVGTVRAGSSPVGGATVRFERFVGEDVERRDVVADGAGRFELRGVPGGRYRIRAFRPPSHAQLEPVIGFYEGRGEHQVDLDVAFHGRVDVRAAIAPVTPVEGDRVNLAVGIGVEAVDGDGVVHTRPAADVRVELGGLGRWRVEGGGSTVAATDGGGSVLFPLECVVAGDPGLFVRVPIARAGGEVVEDFPLGLPSCVTLTPQTAPPPATDQPALDAGAGGDVAETTIPQPATTRPITTRPPATQPTTTQPSSEPDGT